MALDFQRAQTDLIKMRLAKAGDAVAKIASHFRAQPIVDASTMDVKAIELLYRKQLDFSNASAMCKADISALRAAACMAKTKAYGSIHCNVEILSIIDPDWIEAMVHFITRGVVIEIVERNQLMRSKLISEQVLNVVSLIRRYGGVVAMDDVNHDDHTLDLIEKIKPDIVKVESNLKVPIFRQACDAQIVVERVESEYLAKSARLAKAELLQGYWCDIAVKDSVPEILTPPGVMARQQQERDLAALLLA